MPRRLTFMLLFAAGCEASLSGDGASTRDDAATVDIDAPGNQFVVDAMPDARVCAGGNAAAMAPDGSCLVHFTTPVTYATAKVNCTNLAPGAHLAYLKTAQLDTFAETFIGNLDTWIGGNDINAEGTFVWEDGTAFNFTAWATGEPNNANGSFQEDCVIIAGARTTKLWDDRPCDASEVATSGNFAYLCQY